jgi:hypothetical protein
MDCGRRALTFHLEIPTPPWTVDGETKETTNRFKIDDQDGRLTDDLEPSERDFAPRLGEKICHLRGNSARIVELERPGAGDHWQSSICFGSCQFIPMPNQVVAARFDNILENLNPLSNGNYLDGGWGGAGAHYHGGTEKG